MTITPPPVPGELRILPVRGIGEIRPGDDLGGIIAEAANADPATELVDGDVLVVTQKIVSKAEDRLERIDPDHPLGHKAIVERESVRILRRRGDLIIAETEHGFVCANAGIDRSNTPDGTAVLLPVDPDASARAIATALRERLGGDVPVVICDTHGRAFRRGLVNVAIGVAGLQPVIDHRGGRDREGRVLVATDQAIADELAAAAGMLMGKDSGTPAIACRGAAVVTGDGSAADLVRDPEEDLFRALRPAPTTL